VNVEREQFVGLDLGQAHDPSAIAVADRVTTTLDEIDGATRERLREVRYELRFLERVKLDTPYPAVVDRVSAVAERLGGRPDLVVDGTGVGRPVVDLLRAAQNRGRAFRLVPVMITSGARVTQSDGWWHVPKRDLVAGLVVGFQRGELRISAQLAHADALMHELVNFGSKLTAAGGETYGNAREAANDDLVLAVSLAVWRAASTLPRGPQGPLPMISL
jgi:hypothetical protein